MPRDILVTGGAGYIGSHTCVSLVESGFRPVIVDNLSNSSPAVIDRIAEISGYRPPLYVADVRDGATLADILNKHDIAATVHFAGLKAVGESVSDPLRYYINNVEGSMRLLEALGKRGSKGFLFSSSATVYGEPDTVPIQESAPLRPASPYGHSKAMVERILYDQAAADPEWRIGVLRYFNPVGAHASGRIGEAPQGTPNNLMPYVAQVAVKQRPVLSVFGGDYPTRDGTGVRDYIHVMDLAEGHVAALRRILEQPGVFTVNLGTGRGQSVLEVIEAFKKASGVSIPYRIAERRAGDVAAYFADPSLAASLLSWHSTRSLKDMCADAWRWQSNNPKGYAV